MRPALVLALAALMVLGACAKGSDDGGSPAVAGDGPPAPAPAPAPVPTPEPGPAPSPEVLYLVDYEFKGKDDKGQECTTGLQKFTTVNLMCIHIQDPVRNKGCALGQRLEKFVKECVPEGHDYYESMACRIVLLDKDTAITAANTFDETKVVKKAEYCIGRGTSGMIIGGISDNGWLDFDSRIGAGVAMTFVPARNRTGTYRSEAVITLHRPGPGPDERIDFVDEFRYTGGVQGKFGRVGDGKYKYSISCKQVWACE